MFELTHKNHFEYGRIEKMPEVFFSKLGAAERAASSGLEASKEAARLIRASTSLRLDLCVSGGIDSEAMLRSFLESRIDVHVNILKFADNLNEYDIHNAIQFCKNQKLSHRIIDLDVIGFFESGAYLEYGKRYQCQSPQLATHLWMLDQIEGCPVLSGNFIFPKRIADGFFYQGLPGDLHCAYFRYFQKTGRQGIPWFFIYTPEQYQAFFKTPLVQMQLAQPIEKQIDMNYAMKCRIYREAGFDVSARDDKYTGFEKLRAHYDEKYGTQFGIKFNELFRAPLEKLNPQPDEFLQIVPLVEVDSPQ